MGEERLLCGAGGRRGHPFAHTQLLLRTHWAGCSELSANSGDRRQEQQSAPLLGKWQRAMGTAEGERGRAGENEKGRVKTTEAELAKKGKAKRKG